MSATAKASVASDINRLHAEVVRQTDESKKCLHAALVAAWQAGQLLLAEKKRVRRTMGDGAWILWLEQNFKASPRTAQKYMRLAEGVADVSALEDLSLRQAYLRLGIATEPKSRANSAHVDELPAHVRLAGKLLVAIKRDAAHTPPERWTAFRQDLRALYDHLRRIFEAGPPNFAGPALSNKDQP
ncbi:MAG: hypothetical protein JWM88_1137 [Verrucomicrobia bacterium]|nr:hypothetical protein [Verrucomicrobiota bacterium]